MRKLNNHQFRRTISSNLKVISSIKKFTFSEITYCFARREFGIVPVHSRKRDKVSNKSCFHTLQSFREGSLKLRNVGAVFRHHFSGRTRREDLAIHFKLFVGSSAHLQNN